MSQPQEKTAGDKANQAHDKEMREKRKKVSFQTEELRASKKPLSLDELLAKANRLLEEGKERDRKMKLMEQESRALRGVTYGIDAFGLAGDQQTELLNKLTAAARKVDADDEKIAQFGAFTQLMSKKCDEYEQFMAQDAQEALLEPSCSSVSGSESVERLDSSPSGSIEQETEDIL